MADLTLVIGHKGTGKTVQNRAEVDTSNEKYLVIDFFNEYALPELLPEQVDAFCSDPLDKRKMAVIFPVNTELAQIRLTILDIVKNFRHGTLLIDNASTLESTAFYEELDDILSDLKDDHDTRLILVYNMQSNMPLLAAQWKTIRLHKTFSFGLGTDRFNKQMRDLLYASQKEVNDHCAIGHNRYYYQYFYRNNPVKKAMTGTKQELLQELRTELLQKGVDTSTMSDDELEAWCNKEGIQIVPPSILN